jgi:DNA primase
MARIPEDTIQTVRDRADIVDLVGRHVALKKAGRTFKGLCPFHQEKSPSFIVTPDRGTYHCFGCGEHGNAFGFLMRQEGLTFPEAVRSLAGELGVEVPETGGADRGEIEAVVRANDVAQAYYRSSLAADEGRGAREYLIGRGISDTDVEKYGIGFAPDRWDGLKDVLRREKISGDDGEKAGVLRARESGGHYDLLRGRLIFPIQDARGRNVAFGGRALGEGQEPKYLNTPESPIFRKREAFYGFPKALEAIRKADRAVVVEGYFDQIALDRAGIGEAVATCGTALSDQHAKNLKRRTKNVILLFDGDEAGQKAILRSLEILLPQGLRVRAASLPGGVDPDDFLNAEGAEALRALIDAAPPAIELAIQRAIDGGIASPWDRADAVAKVVPQLALIQDPVERGEFARQLALRVGTEPRDVEAAVRRAVRGGGSGDDEAPKELEPRRETPEDRHYATVLRLVLDHADSLTAFDRDAVLALAPNEDWKPLAEVVLDASFDSGRIDALLDELEGARRARLSALANEPRPELDNGEMADQILSDELVWLTRQRAKRDAAAVNAQLRGGSDPTALLKEKQRQLEERRRAQDLPPSRSAES